jgi:hypothetical protein
MTGKEDIWSRLGRNDDSFWTSSTRKKPVKISDPPG